METLVIDELDKQLIIELQNDGKQSYRELSRKFNVAEGTVRRRINVLIQKELIRVVAEVNVQKIGFDLIAVIVIRMQPGRRDEVAEKLAKMPQICYLASVVGNYDLIAIAIAKSSEELHKSLGKAIRDIPGVPFIEISENQKIIKGFSPSMETSQLISELYKVT